MSLIAQDLTCSRQSRLILAGVSFALAPGEALVLRGPNGVGKTTLLRCLAGLLPIEGRLEHGGIRLSDDREKYSENIALSGHLDGLKGAMNVGETLNFWADLYGQTLGDIPAEFSLEELLDRLTSRLSAGQKRRLGLARLPLSGARLWLMDEPTVSLDQENTARLTGMLQAHLARGGMAVISTHLPLDIKAEILELSRPEAPAQADPFLAGFAS